ncbi:prolyl oligopeptidase family serine peptidase [Streptomyces sp. RB6PN25]|uniref:Prolyl oligopeptidase family serine peptidase n=1 Tax=Streptomyces humicola TaxID=2953240 RepID=A0ABT1Q4Q7_9ACTN|nr:prolyl oligopeptidase family serine peptidase [Streptomyces humicola]MCQ4084872.1 prolyl oligopeptidase family serine peptidase [Streptomyces humicola]
MASTNSPDLMAFPRQFARTSRFTLGVPRDATVSPDGARVLFLRTRAGDDPVPCLWAHEDGKERLLAEDVTAYATDAHARFAAFARDGRLWTVRMQGPGSDVPRQVPTPGPVAHPRPDPTGTHIAYVSDGALHVVDPADGTDRVLATPEGPQVSYGIAEQVAAESMHRSRGYWWAPDGERLLVARVDHSSVRRLWISDPAHPERPPRSLPYPVAGTPNAEVTLYVLAVRGGRVEVVWDRAAYEYLASADWDAHGPLITVQSRDQRTVHTLTADPGTGETTAAGVRTDPAWVHLVPGTPARTASGATVCPEEQDSVRRLRIGEVLSPRGLQLREVLGIDGDRVLFTASEEPTEVHVWSYAPEHGFVRVSDGPGVHTATWGGGTVALHSRAPDGHRTTVLRDGEVLGRIASLAEEPVVTPRITWLRTGEREIRTVLLLPSWYTPGTRLPVLLTPYGGAGLQLVVRTRDWWLCRAQWFAEHGFAVVVADGRGTPGRGPAWEKAVHGDKLTAALDDQVVAVRGAAEHCQDLDLGRVGILGWSYSGYLAAAAVLRRPEVFHAAVAGAAPCDMRLYETHWQERFLGHPDEHPENYDNCSIIADAPRLDRPLLLIHGLEDDNVTVAHTLRMSAALLAAGRPHRVLLLPGTSHAVDDPVVAENLLHVQRDFLCDALNAAIRAPR